METHLPFKLMFGLEYSHVLTLDGDASTTFLTILNVVAIGICEIAPIDDGNQLHDDAFLNVLRGYKFKSRGGRVCIHS